MSVCKFCQKAFSWGLNEGRYVPLVPVDEHKGLDRSFQDENGELRAEHALVCVRRGGPTVRVARLARTVRASEIITPPTSFVDPDSGEILYEEPQNSCM